MCPAGSLTKICFSDMQSGLISLCKEFKSLCLFEFMLMIEMCMLSLMIPSPHPSFQSHILKASIYFLALPLLPWVCSLPWIIAVIQVLVSLLWVLSLQIQPLRNGLVDLFKIHMYSLGCILFQSSSHQITTHNSIKSEFLQRGT